MLSDALGGEHLTRCLYWKMVSTSNACHPALLRAHEPIHGHWCSVEAQIGLDLVKWDVLINDVWDGLWMNIRGSFRVQWSTMSGWISMGVTQLLSLHHATCYATTGQQLWVVVADSNCSPLWDAWEWPLRAMQTMPYVME